MKLLISATALALTLLTSTGAIAQVGPQGVPMSSSRVQQPQDGVTVSAIGSAKGEATSVQFTLNIGTRNNTDTISTGDLQPIVDALVASGVDRSSIHLPVYMQPTGSRVNNAMITGTAANPTQAKLQQAIVNVSSAFGANSKLYINNSQVTLRIDDCGAIADASRTDAIRRARDRALATAHDLGVKLGAVESATISAPIDATGSCSQMYNLPYNPPPQDGDTFSVRVTTPVTLRYAIH